MDPPARTELKFKSIPAEDIPERIGDMVITPELRESYKGHEILLKHRSKHTPECYTAFDAVRLCLVGRVQDPDTCARVAAAYEPCVKERRKAQVGRMMAAEDERRKLLAAQAKLLDTERK